MYIRSYTNIYKKNWDIHIFFILEKIHKSSPDPLSVAVRPWTKGAFRTAGYGLICRSRLPIHVFIPMANGERSPHLVRLITKMDAFVKENVQNIVEGFNIVCVHSVHKVLRTLIHDCFSDGHPQ